MSLFYKSLSAYEAFKFRKRKQAFKKGKPCAVCGKTYPKGQMMVAHIIPVRQLTDYDALYDTSNWEVRCIYCERRLNREETLKKNIMEKKAKEKHGIVPMFEMDNYIDYEDLIQHIWDRVVSPMNMQKIHRRSSYYQRIVNAVKMIDRLTLAKATARFVLCNGRIPVKEEVNAQLIKDVETKMLFETKGHFKKEKEE